MSAGRTLLGPPRESGWVNGKVKTRGAVRTAGCRRRIADVGSGPIEIDGTIPEIEIKAGAVREVIEVVALAILPLERGLPLESAAQRQVPREPAFGADPIFVGREVVALVGREHRPIDLLGELEIVRAAELQVRRQLERGRLQLHDVGLRGRIVARHDDPLLQISARIVHVGSHVFHREADDLYCEVPISFSVAALGGEIDVPTLEGKAHLKVPVGTQSGQTFKLRGKGITNINGRGHGDLFARLIVEVPSRLNPEQRRKLEEFAALCGDENTPMRRSFFDRAKEFFK